MVPAYVLAKTIISRWETTSSCVHRFAVARSDACDRGVRESGDTDKEGNSDMSHTLHRGRDVPYLRISTDDSWS